MEGYENSKFFRGIINCHKKRSRINGLNMEGDWVTDSVHIMDEVWKFLSSKFYEWSGLSLKVEA